MTDEQPIERKALLASRLLDCSVASLTHRLNVAAKAFHRIASGAGHCHAADCQDEQDFANQRTPPEIV
jgi:hypothetical protein